MDVNEKSSIKYNINKHDQVNINKAICTKKKKTIRKCNRKETKIIGTPSGHGHKKRREEHSVSNFNSWKGYI
jgi:hypothetical protein